MESSIRPTYETTFSKSRLSKAMTDKPALVYLLGPHKCHDKHMHRSYVNEHGNSRDPDSFASVLDGGMKLSAWPIVRRGDFKAGLDDDDIRSAIKEAQGMTSGPLIVILALEGTEPIIKPAEEEECNNANNRNLPIQRSSQTLDAPHSDRQHVLYWSPRLFWGGYDARLGVFLYVTEGCGRFHSSSCYSSSVQGRNAQRRHQERIYHQH